MVLLVRYPATREAERSYIFDVLLRDFLGLEYAQEPHEGADIQISVCGGLRKQLTIADVFLACAQDEWLTVKSLPRPPLAIWDGSDAGQLPVIYGRAKEGRLFSASEKDVYLGLDIFGSAFFMLTRYEEAVRPERDSLDRFPPTGSSAFQEGFLHRPIVNEYLELLWSAMQRLWPQLKRSQRNYRVLLSHDVDELSLLARTWTSMAFSLLADLVRRRELGLAARRVKAYIATRFSHEMVDHDPYNTFDFLMDTSDRLGLRSAFNLVPEGSHAYDPRYALGDPWVRRLLRHIHKRGHEIGFHASYDTYADAERTKQEFNYLRRVCEEEGVRQAQWGGRQHYLRWKNPTTWQNWESSGINYDSTLTYAQHVGFRCGCCYEYPVFNLLSRQTLRLRERPLVAMEGSLLNYMGLSLEAAEARLQELVRTCRRFQGDFTLLWHNSTLLARAAQQAYSRIVEMAAA